MLILMRKTGETVLIEFGDGRPPVTVMVCDVNGNRVRLGFQADKAVKIWRSELKDQAQKKEAE